VRRCARRAASQSGPLPRNRHLSADCRRVASHPPRIGSKATQGVGHRMWSSLGRKGQVVARAARSLRAQTERA